MARPVSTDSKRTMRSVTVTYSTIPELEAAKAHAKKRGLPLATLYKHLLAVDMDK
jgi:hypothetical protein